jgi:hypothetical protein
MATIWLSGERALAAHAMAPPQGAPEVDAQCQRHDQPRRWRHLDPIHRGLRATPAGSIVIAMPL